jgi:Ca2+-binding RTX toxin-like protein
MTIQGVYVANSPADLNKFESWLGNEVDAVHGVVGFANWTDYTSSANWMTNTVWKGINESVLWSVPIIVDDGVSSLAAAANGSYNANYRSVAQTLLASRAGDNEPIYIRTGWEANADWFPWSAIGKEGSFIGAFRQMVDTFRDISPRFKFEWNINFAEGGLDPAKMYPGDAYVDVVGMDFYWTPEYQGSDPVKAFNAIANAKYGLQWLENFADAHGKPTAYSEWGINSNNASEYLKLVKGWFDTHDVVYQSFWNYTMDKVQALSGGALPDSGAAFRDLFSGHTDSSTPTAPPVITPPVVALPVTSQPGTALNPIHGTSGADTLSGTAGNDAFNGQGGDQMSGGKGDDTYVVNSSADVVIEKAGEGTDTVSTWTNNYVLADNVENLVVTGTGWNIASGNALNNRITGNDSANTLDGKGGNDVLTGGGGNDTFVIAKGMGNDTITDFVPGASAGEVIRLDGFAFSDFAAVKAAAAQSGGNVVIALGSSQTLTLQNVQLSALTADDVSLVNIAKPSVTPPVVTPPVVSPPVVTSPVTTMPTALPVSGSATQQFWGTSGRDSMTGTNGNDGFLGNGGDTMAGGLGDDTYTINTLTDLAVEKAGGGIDTVSTWISGYVLADNVENLVLTGHGWSVGTGNALNNRIIGNESHNTLNGQGGNDLLTGGAGNDTFVIAKGQGSDVITDFQDGMGKGDTINLDGFSFANFAAVKAASAQVGGNVVIQLGGGQTLTLQDEQLASLVADDVNLTNIAAGTTPVTTPVATSPVVSPPVVTQPVTPPVTTTPVATMPTVLPVSGAATQQFWGTSGRDSMTGTNGNDGFLGNGGDTMAGGLGDDTYTINTLSDLAVEKAGGGIDTVSTWISGYVLADNVENLVVTGHGWSVGTGNALNNRIIGNESHNTLNGQGGNDLLTGGGGNDTFVIAKGQGSDVITDFQLHAGNSGDTLLLKGFGAGATLSNVGSDFMVRSADGSVEHVTLSGIDHLGTSDYVFA